MVVVVAAESLGNLELYFVEFVGNLILRKSTGNERPLLPELVDTTPQGLINFSGTDGKCTQQ